MRQHASGSSSDSLVGSITAVRFVALSATSPLDFVQKCDWKSSASLGTLADVPANYKLEGHY